MAVLAVPASPCSFVLVREFWALDVYGAGLLGLDGPEASMIRRAYEHGLGEIDLAKLRVLKLNRTA